MAGSTDLDLGATEIEQRIRSVSFGLFGLPPHLLAPLRTQDGRLFSGQERRGRVRPTGQTFLPLGHRCRGRLKETQKNQNTSGGGGILEKIKTAPIFWGTKALGGSGRTLHDARRAKYSM